MSNNQYNLMFFLVLFFVFVFLSSLFFPQYTLILIYVNLAVAVALSILQLGIILFPKFKPVRSKLKSHSFVSILVPSYNEPPAILINTLDSLSNLTYGNFEVLVIDNNTRDTSVWKPAKRFVESLGGKFRFFHVDKLSGFKAGALNYLMKRVDERAEFAAVIDADYIVNPDFLDVALPYFANEKIALVQFPQRYRNSIRKNKPIVDEYSHFFGIYMNMANHLNCVPSTGTVSIYRLNVLRKIGGFSGKALTEDADIGLRIYGAGYGGVYVDYPVGYGLMPYDLEAYRKQKWRWAFGNAQSMKLLVSLFGKIPFRSWFGFLSHLTAWDHFHFIPFAVLASFTILLLPFVPITDDHRHLLDVAAFTILVTIVAKLMLFVANFKFQKKGIGRALRAFVTHMGMTVVYSEAWLAFIFNAKYGFERTNKFILNKMPSVLKNSYTELLLGLWFTAGAVEAFFWGRPTTVIAYIIAVLSLFSVYYVYWSITPTKIYSKKMVSLLETKYCKYISGSLGRINILPKKAKNNHMKEKIYENSTTGSFMEKSSS